MAWPSQRLLDPTVPMRLEPDGVHARIGCKPYSAGLHDLRPTHLSTVGGNAGIVGHVLRSEWRNAITVFRQTATARCHEQALAGVTARTLQHDGASVFGCGARDWRTQRIPERSKESLVLVILAQRDA